MCVNGDNATRRILTETLSGYDLEFATAGYDALRKINTRAFDLYIIEFWLPDWSGVSLCRYVRKADPHVPVCFCTAAARPEDERRARKAGASAYILKPLDPSVLNQQATALLRAVARDTEAARKAARSAVQQELERRVATLGDAVFSDSFDNTLKRIARAKASAAFLGSGGTLAVFERKWDALWARRFLNAA